MSTSISQSARPQGDAPALPPATSRLLVPALALAVLAFSMMQTLLVPALPSFMVEFDIDSALAGWILTSFLLCGAVAAPILGSLGDRFGHRKMLILTLAIFLAGSVITILTNSFMVLLIGRVLQGASTATFPLALAIVRLNLSGAPQRAAFGWLSGVVGLGAGVALVVGGLVLEASSWQWLFVTGAFMGALALILVIIAVPTSGRGKPGRTDWAGTALLVVGLVSFLLAISQGGKWGWASLEILGLFLLGAIALLCLVFVELRTESPLIDMRTLARPALAITHGISLFIGFIPYTFYIGLPVLLQSPATPGIGHGFTVTQTGLALLPGALLVFFGGRFAPALITRLGVKATACIALLIMAIGSLGIALAPNNLAMIIGFFAIFGLGNGFGFTVLANLVALMAPQEEIAAAMGVNSVVRTVGSALGTPVATTILASVALSNSGAATLNSYSVLFMVSVATSILGTVLALTLRISSRR
ncbi:MFS transporter [Arthrobacter sp. MYb227]|uniref:MFS transporter n=1 Tax=Arthrobacter sp. MYb227 TaxID=1848601 RepID=UPI000CFDC847|nr:MFS transporter [Arthrobacter sp. MYb227]PQZ85950.1 MFS transporter [Arthrobacter sp. MYb227]